MTSSKKLIRDYEFNKETPQKLIEDNFYTGWPVVYILNNEDEMYIGETYHTPERMKQHFEISERRKLKDLHVIGSSDFTKSATLDIESSLIELCKLENKRKLQNANDGLVNHSFANKDYFRKDSLFFASLWNQLKAKGLVEGNIENLLNSDLFKYSPYKSLNAEQCTTRDYVLEEIEECLITNSKRTIFINGSAGTGKTILAIYLMKLLVTNGAYLSDGENSDTLLFVETLNKIKLIKPKLKVGYVVAMESLRTTLQHVFKDISGLNAKMVISPSEALKEHYDVLIVDEAHRLKQRKNLENGFSYTAFAENNAKLGLGNEGTQLDWIIDSSQIQILFYDSEQTIKPTDVDAARFNELLDKAPNSRYNLSSQMRCIGGSDYIKYVKDILSENNPVFIDFDDKYEFLLFDDIHDFCDSILAKEKKEKLSRIVAGYAWPWNNKGGIDIRRSIVEANNIEIKDIVINDRSFFWNRHDKRWPLSISGDAVVNEIGCIHTIQGYDLNYCGVIFGNEIKYCDGKIIIDKSNYYDVKGKMNIETAEQLKDYIINIYSVLMTRGIKGTYVYVCDDGLRRYMSKYIKSGVSI